MPTGFLKLTKTAALASLLACAASAAAQDDTIYPLDAPEEPNAIPLGTGGVEGQPAPESWFRQWGEPMARNVSTATLTPFLPDPAKANGAAAIVAPGGGFRWLSMNNEGWKVAKALADRGVDTDRIGMIGFSAGAGLTMHCTLNSKTMKLAFIGPIYGGMQAVEVPEDAPPMFAAIASDDFLFRGEFGLITSWFEAGRPVEFHLYQNGGHGFGLGYPDRTANGWFPVFMHWLDVNKFLVAKAE